MMSFLYSQLVKKLPYPTGSNQGKIIITGSNTGLGKEAARHYARLGTSHLILAVRDIEKGFEAKKDIEATTNCKVDCIQVWQIDMANYSSVQNLAARISSELDRIDILLLNAGCAKFKYEVAEGNETQITVNVISTFLLAFLVMPKLKEMSVKYGIRPTLSITSSGAHKHTTFPQKEAADGKILATISDETFAKEHWTEQYPVSKLLGIFIIRSLGDRYPAPDFPVTINCVSPGLCHSSLDHDHPTLVFTIFEFLFARSMEVGSRTLAHGGASGSQSHGKYLEDCSIGRPAKLMLDNKVVQDQIWTSWWRG